MPYTEAMRVHADAEMAQAIALGREIEKPTGTYPEHVWRAMRLAYAVHYRVLMEFFHDPPRPKPPSSDIRRDIHFSDFLPTGHKNRLKWTERQKRRFFASNKLAAHLSVGRTRRHQSRVEWGGRSDRTDVVRKIGKILASLPDPRVIFPDTATAYYRNAKQGASSIKHTKVSRAGRVY